MAEENRWEYHVETLGSFWSGIKDDELQELINAWGEEGWEILQVLNLPNSEKLRIIAKRPLKGAVRRRRSWPE